MNQQRALQIQSYLDDALPAGERREVEVALANDSAARALLENLRRVRDGVAANEPVPKLAESREFYWSKIQRQIAAADQVPKPEELSLWRWIANLAPFAAMVVIAVGLAWYSVKPPLSNPADAEQEIASAIGEADAITFYSPEAQMTVVWVDLTGN